MIILNSTQRQDSNIESLGFQSTNIKGGRERGRERERKEREREKVDLFRSENPLLTGLCHYWIREMPCSTLLFLKAVENSKTCLRN